jgi:hypothetical protein
MYLCTHWGKNEATGGNVYFVSDNAVIGGNMISGYLLIITCRHVIPNLCQLSQHTFVDIREWCYSVSCETLYVLAIIYFLNILVGTS